MSLVSVIMPNHNGASTLAEAIQSVLNQTHSHLELLVVDDGSTDSSRQVVASFEDPRVQLFEQARAGAGAARNVGLNRARGEFLAFLDADDRYLPDTLEFFVSASLEHPEVDLFYGDVYWEKVSEVISSLEPPFINYVPCVSTIALFGRNMDVLRFDEELRSGFEEWDLLLRIQDQLRLKHLPRQVAVAGNPPGPRLLGDKEPRQIAAVYREVVLRHMHHPKRDRCRTVVIAKEVPHPAAADVTFVMLNHLRLFWGEPFDLAFDTSESTHDSSNPERHFGFTSFETAEDMASFVREGCYETVFCTRSNLLVPKDFRRPPSQPGISHQPALVRYNTRMEPKLFASHYEPHPILVESIGPSGRRGYDPTVRCITAQDYLDQANTRLVELPDALLVI
jgi:glycosyltransferase involved in cell wall biosynthesis